MRLQRVFDGFVLNGGYPKLDWVHQTLSHLYGYADSLINKGGKFRLALSLDLYATGAWSYDKKLGDDCGGPEEYEAILKSFLGRDSYLRYGPDNFPFITSFSTGRQTYKDFAAWKKSFANEMYFVPGIDDTPGFWESHPAWWDYWGELIDGASVWESAWPEVHGTNEGDLSRGIKVVGPLQRKGKTFMVPISMLQYKNAYGANLYRRGEMNVVKRMENILSMDPQPDIIQLLTLNDGPESHHFGNLWPEQNTDAQPNQYASPDGSDHTALQSLYSAFIHAWKNGGSMVPAFSKRDESIPQGALWHKTLLTGLNYGTVENCIEEGTQRLVIKNGDTLVAGTDRGRCLSQECHDGIYNFNPQIMPVKSDFDNSDCWQVEGEPFLDWAGEKVVGTTLGPPDADPGHNHNSPYASVPFDGFVGCSLSQKEDIKQAWRDFVTILAKIPTLRIIRASCQDLTQVGFDIQTRCNSIKDTAGTIGGYTFDDATSSPGGTIVFCGGFFAPGQEHLAAVQRELDADKTKQKNSIFMTGKFRLMIHELVHLPSVSNNLIGSGKESDVVIKDQYLGADQQKNAYKVYMPEMVEKLAKKRTRRHLTATNAETYAWYTVGSFFTAFYGSPPNSVLTGRDDDDPTTTSSIVPEPQPTEQPTTYDCKGSGICGLSTFQVK
ncbi:glycoside hydrolase family 71 [Fusarium beomiforme]|uniref:Glycoside hydrolase family 71 n=1 Tax=Fusarium beomiforme TaxID=44412 RepID=A0A9P5AFQ8_9HYPO|nr:glycoside hydrolase family 71 [Fusarium beomiforme]